jgi:2-dehydro-3-deoxygluconokinase
MLTPTLPLPLHRADNFVAGIGGAESNVAMGLASMGIDAHWISRVGRDGFGTRILAELNSHGVGTSAVAVDPWRPTGLYFKAPEGVDDRGNAVLYHRRGSAASAMSPDMLSDPIVAARLRSADLIHLSGITAALSPDCLQLMREILTAGYSNSIVSFDVNWRSNLWAGQDPSVLTALTNLSDIALTGKDEAEQAFGTSDERKLRALLPNPKVLVIKNDDVSAVSLTREGQRIEVPALSVEVVEPVGAGDAFAAGYLSGILLGLDQKSCLRRGHISAACTLTTKGDHGPLPPEHIVNRLLKYSEASWINTSLSAQGFK